MTGLSNGSVYRIAFRGFVLASSFLVSTSVVAQAEGEADGNRYYLERYYQGEISAAKTFLDGVVNKLKWGNRADKLIILDVRDATEYKLGHPPFAHHFPYPRVYRACNLNPSDLEDPVLRPEDGGDCLYGTASTVTQTPKDLFDMVEDKFPNKSQRFATVCRTGYRSVRAANILAKPEKYVCDSEYEVGSRYHTDCVGEYTGRGYTRVSNMWQGFVGQPMPGIVKMDNRYVVGEDQVLTDATLDDGTTAKGFVAKDLDLDKDGEITAADKDGWRYHQGLPYSTRLHRRLKNEMVDAEGYYDEP